MRQWRQKYLIAVALVGLLALAAGPVLAQTDSTAPAPGPHHHAGMMMAKMAQKLNLTDDQVAAVKQLHQDLATKMAPIHQQQQQLRTQLKTALAVASPDAATVGKLVIQQHQASEQMKPIMAEFHQQFQALLNPDQLATYKQMLASHTASRHFPGGQNQAQ
jgi:Spy/CpxP family protein refolding chaperone